MGQYAITARFEVMAGKEDAFMVEMKQQAEDTVSQEPGCLYFDVCVSQENPAVVLLYEIYTDKAAFDAHLDTPYFKAFIEKVRPWLSTNIIEAWNKL